MTAADYHNDPEYAAFLKLWVERGEPELEFADWLWDRELWLQGECVKWVLTRNRRKIWGDFYSYARAYPMSIGGLEHVWDYESDTMEFYAGDVPPELFRILNTKRPVLTNTQHEALTALLDGFALWKQPVESDRSPTFDALEPAL